jgi:hypothetical protein
MGCEIESRRSPDSKAHLNDVLLGDGAVVVHVLGLEALAKPVDLEFWARLESIL